MATEQGLVLATTIPDSYNGDISGALGDNDGDYINDINYRLRQPDGVYNTELYANETVS